MSLLQNYKNDGAQQAVVVVSLFTVASLLLPRRSGGSFVRYFDEEEIVDVSRGRTDSTPGASKRASAWSRFVADRVPRLVREGHSTEDAMQIAADEFLARSSGS